jgi:hypothetical protein
LTSLLNLNLALRSRDLIHPICQYERFGNRALSGLSEGPDCLIVYLSELRFINPRSDASEF